MARNRYGQQPVSPKKAKKIIDAAKIKPPTSPPKSPKITQILNGKVDKNTLLDHIADKSLKPEQQEDAVGNAPPAAVQRNTIDHVKRKFEPKILAL